jgi:hypothetical protein
MHSIKIKPFDVIDPQTQIAELDTMLRDARTSASVQTRQIGGRPAYLQGDDGSYVLELKVPQRRAEVLLVAEHFGFEPTET